MKPPMIAAAKASITTLPMSGVISSLGDSRMPAIPASPAARPQATMRIDFTGMPISAAARGFWLVARSALPIRVQPKNALSASITSSGDDDDRDVLLLQDDVADEHRRAGHERRQPAHLLGVGHDAHRALEQVAEPDGGDDERHQVGLGVAGVAPAADRC